MLVNGVIDLAAEVAEHSGERLVLNGRK